MLIICNGTFKSGSSWLHAIVVEILKVKSISISTIPTIYNLNLASPTRILEKNVIDFITKEDLISKTYVTKSHYFSLETLSYNYSDSVFFLFIERELKDAIISHYFHFKNYRLNKVSFTIYFWLIGIFKAYEICIYNERSKNKFPQNNYFTFEGFKNHFSDNINKLTNLLGFNDLSDGELKQVKENTSLKNMKKQAILGKNKYYPELKKDSYKLFRSGKIGEWKYFFSKRQLIFLENMLNGHTSLLIKFGYFVLFTFRRKIGL